MNEKFEETFSHDAAFTRLLAADPSAHAEPDFDRLRAKVTARIDATPGDELTSRRTSKRWWAGAAAAVAGAVIIGSGGFALGNVASGSSSAATANSASNGYFYGGKVASNKLAGLALGSAPAMMAPRPGSSLQGASTTIPSHSRFEAARSLVVSPMSLTAYTFNTSAADTATLATNLGRAVGIAAAPTWVAATSTYVAAGRGQRIAVAADSARTFSYHRDSQVISANTTCAGGAPLPILTAPAAGAVTSLAPLAQCESQPFAFDRATQAVGIARNFMARAGVEPTNYAWSTTGSLERTIVRAIPKLSGAKVSAPASTWLFAVDNQSTLLAASGSLASLKSLGKYAVVDAATAVSRLNDPGFTTFSLNMDYQSYATSASASGHVPYAPSGVTDSANAGVVNSEKSPGAKFAWPITKVTITSATIELAEYIQPDGSLVLLPTYVMTASNGSKYHVLAVSGQSLITSTP